MRFKKRMHVRPLLNKAITLLFPVLGAIQLYAYDYSFDMRLLPDLTNCTIKQALQKIEDQSDYRFFYNELFSDLDKKISVSFGEKSIDAILNQVFKDTDISYKIMPNHLIIITPAPENIKQQSLTVSGRITDVAGQALPGVTIMVMGTNQGIISDSNGNYSLENVPFDATLHFSFVGMKTLEIQVAGQPVINITMETVPFGLEEIIAVGYSSTARRDLIASVSTVKTEQISNIPVTNIAQGLAGRSPGLIVKASGGGINSRPSISIRGGGTPIYVIDGIIRSEDDFVNILPDDIAGMSILKDASATAVYGSRASNGIIQITTKKGQRGKSSIEYDFNYSVAQPNIWPEQMDSYSRALHANIARANDGLEPAYNDAALQAFLDGSDPLNFSNTDWRKLVLNDWAPQTKHTVRLTGGENNPYYVSLGHVYQNSLYKSGTHWMKRTNFRLAQTSSIKAINLQVNVAIDGYYQKETHPSTSNADSYHAVFSHINDRPSVYPGLNQYGLPYEVTDNPIAETAQDAGYKRNKYHIINGKGELIWDFLWIQGLKIKLAGNYRFYSNTVKNWRKDAAKYAWDSLEPQYDNTPQLYYLAYSGYAFTNQAFAEYNNTFGKHTVFSLAGFEQYYTKGESYWLQRVGYDFDIDQIEVGPEADQDNGGSESELGRAAWIAHVKYNYANKYYAEANLRYDGSDYFAPGNRWGLFFSGSLGWMVSEEIFFQPLREQNIFNMLKGRVSYGETGLDSSVGRFAYLTSYSLDTKAYVVDGEYVPGFSEGSLPSPDLTWYTTHQINVGFDFASLRNRLYGSFDYFYHSTKGYLMAPVGESYINTALGIGMPNVKSDSEYRRAGIEIQLGWRSNIGALMYDVAANFTHYDQLWARNESEAESSYLNPYQRTQQQTGYYGLLLHNEGYYQSAEDVYNSAGYLEAYNSGYLTAGDIKYEDTNGDGRITSADLRRLGKSSNPRGQFGININLSYKGFNFSTLLQGSTAFDMYIPGSMGMQTGQTYGMPVAYEYQTDYWTPTNTDAQYPRLMSNTGLNANNNYISSDFWLVNGAYLRMKDFQLSYDFKYTLLKKEQWLSKAKVGISGLNVFTISQAVKYGLDPENSSTNNYGYPVERIFAFTLNLGF